MNILFIPGAKPKWTYGYICTEMARYHNVYILDDARDSSDSERKLLSVAATKTFSCRYGKYIYILEKVLMFITKRPKTAVIKNISYRSKYLSKYPIIQNVISIIPKPLSSNITAKILSLLPSEYKKELKRLHIDRVMYVSVHVNNYYPICAARGIVKEIICWIYSWDNPFKDVFLPNIFNKYFVWNEFMKHDLVKIHSVPYERQHSIGPVQFDYLKKGKLNEKLRSILPKKYLLFTFGTGLETIEQEIDILHLASRLLSSVDSSFFIVARTYPGSNKSENILPDKHKEGNIVYFDSDRYEYGADFNQVNSNKFTLIKESQGIINIGTTMGLEASLMNKPVIQVSFLPDASTRFDDRKRYFNLDVILQNDHLKNYVLKYEYTNVAKNENDLKTLLVKIVRGDMDLMKYSAYLKNLIDPDYAKLSIKELVNNI